MLAPNKIQEVKQLLAEGRYSHRQIAQVVGMSRTSVGAIASGKRPDYALRRVEREGEPYPEGPLTRCGGCGGMVSTPCRLCHIRQVKNEEEALLRTYRRRAREQTLKKLLEVVRKAAQRREAAASMEPARAMRGG